MHAGRTTFFSRAPPAMRVRRISIVIVATIAAPLAVACGVGEPVDPTSLPDKTREAGDVFVVDAKGSLRDRRAIAATMYKGLSEFYFVAPSGRSLSYADGVYEDNRSFWSPNDDVADIVGTHADTTLSLVYWSHSSAQRARGRVDDYRRRRTLVARSARRGFPDDAASASRRREHHASGRDAVLEPSHRVVVG